MNKVTQTVLFGRVAATIDQQVEVFDEQGNRSHSGSLTIVAEIDAGKLKDPVLVTRIHVPAAAEPMIDEWARKNFNLLPGASLFRRIRPGANKLAVNLTREQKIDVIVEMAHYAVQWPHGSADEDRAYILGSIETTGHAIACALCQWFSLEQGVGTAETVEALKLETCPGRDELHTLIEAYLVELERNEES